MSNRQRSEEIRLSRLGCMHGLFFTKSIFCIEGLLSVLMTHDRKQAAFVFSTSQVTYPCEIATGYHVQNVQKSWPVYLISCHTCLSALNKRTWFLQNTH